MPILFRFILVCLFPLSVIAQERGGVVTSFGGSNRLVGEPGKRKAALIIGVSDYHSPNLRLKYANKDALLFQQYLLSSRNLPQDNISFLPDSLATAGRIYNQIHSLMQELSAGDELFIYFAGHGDVQTVSTFNEAFLLAWDASGSRNYKGIGGVVEMKDLQEYTEHLAEELNVNVTLILDACHSGFDQYQDGIQKAQAKISRQFNLVNKWTGCAVNEFSYEIDSIGHGLFTWYLVQGLMGLADEPADNKLTAEELKSFVGAKVSASSNGKQHPQLNIPEGKGFAIEVKPEDKIRALTLFRKNQYDGAMAGRGEGSKADTTGQNQLRSYIDNYNRFLLAGKYYDSDSSSLGVISQLSQQPQKEARELSISLKNHLAEVFETRSQLVLNEYLRGKSELPAASRYFIAGRESALADSLLSPGDPRKKINQVMSAFHKAFSYLRYERFEKYGEVESLLRSAIDLEPDAAYLYVALSYLMGYRQQYDSAIFYAEKANSIIPTWTHPKNILGNLFEETYQYRQALEQHFSVLKYDSNYIWSYNNIGNTYKSMGRLPEAEIFFMKALDKKNNTKGENIARDLAIAYNNLGTIFDDRKQFTKAENYYKRALESDPAFTLPMRNLSSLYETYDGAASELLLKNSIKAMPYEAINYYSLAEFYRNYPYRVGLLDSAAEIYRKTILLDPFETGGYYGMGYLQFDLNQKDSALYWMKKGLSPTRYHPDLMSEIAHLFHLLGNNDSALFYYKETHAANPFNIDHAFSYADFLLETRDTLSAIRLLSQMENDQQGVPAFFYSLGNFYYSINQVKQAIFCFEKVVAIDSNYQPAWEALAYLLLRQGKTEQSLEILLDLKNSEDYKDFLFRYKMAIAELVLEKPLRERSGWLKGFMKADPQSPMLNSLLLQYSYLAYEDLKPVFYKALKADAVSEQTDPGFLKWLLVSAIELNDMVNAKKLAIRYLEEVMVPEQAIKAMAYFLIGKKELAKTIKNQTDSDALKNFRPNFNRLFRQL